jgi:hypothetical protein
MAPVWSKHLLATKDDKGDDVLTDEELVDVLAILGGADLLRGTNCIEVAPVAASVANARAKFEAELAGR